MRHALTPVFLPLTPLKAQGQLRAVELQKTSLHSSIPASGVHYEQQSPGATVARSNSRQEQEPAESSIAHASNFDKTVIAEEEFSFQLPAGPSGDPALITKGGPAAPLVDVDASPLPPCTPTRPPGITRTQSAKASRHSHGLSGQMGFNCPPPNSVSSKQQRAALGGNRAHDLGLAGMVRTMTSEPFRGSYLQAAERKRRSLDVPVSNPTLGSLIVQMIDLQTHISKQDSCEANSNSSCIGPFDTVDSSSCTAYGSSPKSLGSSAASRSHRASFLLTGGTVSPPGGLAHPSTKSSAIARWSAAFLSVAVESVNDRLGNGPAVRSKGNISPPAVDESVTQSSLARSPPQ